MSPHTSAFPFLLIYGQDKMTGYKTEVTCEMNQYTENTKVNMDQEQTAAMQYLSVPITLSSSIEDESHITRVDYSFPEICLEYCIVIIALGCFLAISTSSKFLLGEKNTHWS